MAAESNRLHSELPSGDPALLNKIAWARRWSERKASVDYALAARKKALDGVGRRSRAEQGFALRTLGWQALWRGDLTRSMDYCLQAEALLPELEFTTERAGIYSNLAIIHYLRNRYDLAGCAIERGLWLMQDETEDTLPTADLLITQANIQRLSGERARAGITLGRARELAAGELIAIVDIATASLLLDDGDANRAMDYAQSSVSAILEARDVVSLPYGRSILADCQMKLGNTLEAVQQITLGMDELKANEDEQARCMMLRQRALIYRSRKDLSRAYELLTKAAHIAKERGFALWQKKIALDCAAVLEAKGDAQGAVDQHKMAWRLQNETRMK